MVDDLFVYTLEAHATDEWPIKELATEVFQLRDLDDRIKAASSFLSQYSLNNSFTV